MDNAHGPIKAKCTERLESELSRGVKKTMNDPAIRVYAAVSRGTSTMTRGKLRSFVK